MCLRRCFPATLVIIPQGAALVNHKFAFFQKNLHLPLYKIEISGIIIIVRCASVAQSVEQGTENPRVIGSIPIGGTTSKVLSFIEKSCKQDFRDEYQTFSSSPQNLASQAFAGAPKFARIAREGAGKNAPNMRP